MPDPALILAILAVPIFLVAAAVNAVHAIRHRREFGLLSISLLMTVLSVWNTVGCVLVAAGMFPDTDPPLSVIWLLLATLATGVLFIIIPSWLFSTQQHDLDVEQVKGMLTEAKAATTELQVKNLEIVNLKQSLEICQTANKYLNRELERKGKADAG